MLPKKVKMEITAHGGQTHYVFSSKSLLSALRRATLLIEAMGERSDETALTHQSLPNKKGKKVHFVKVSV